MKNSFEGTGNKEYAENVVLLKTLMFVSFILVFVTIVMLVLLGLQATRSYSFIKDSSPSLLAEYVLQDMGARDIRSDKPNIKVEGAVQSVFSTASSWEHETTSVLKEVRPVCIDKFGFAVLDQSGQKEIRDDDGSASKSDHQVKNDRRSNP